MLGRVRPPPDDTLSAQNACEAIKQGQSTSSSRRYPLLGKLISDKLLRMLQFISSLCSFIIAPEPGSTWIDCEIPMAFPMFCATSTPSRIARTQLRIVSSSASLKEWCACHRRQTVIWQLGFDECQFRSSYVSKLCAAIAAIFAHAGPF